MMIVVGSMAVGWQARDRITGVSSHLICKWRKKKGGREGGRMKETETERERMCAHLGHGLGLKWVFSQSPPLVAHLHQQDHTS